MRSLTTLILMSTGALSCLTLVAACGDDSNREDYLGHWQYQSGSPVIICRGYLAETVDMKGGLVLSDGGPDRVLVRQLANGLDCGHRFSVPSPGEPARFVSQNGYCGNAFFALELVESELLTEDGETLVERTFARYRYYYVPCTFDLEATLVRTTETSTTP